MNKIKSSEKQEGLVFGVLRVVSGGAQHQFIVPCIGMNQKQVLDRVFEKWAGNPRISEATWLSEDEFRRVLPESRALEPCISFVNMSREAITLPPLKPEEFPRR